jgi:hypothetical protein
MTLSPLPPKPDSTGASPAVDLLAVPSPSPSSSPQAPLNILETIKADIAKREAQAQALHDAQRYEEWKRNNPSHDQILGHLNDRNHERLKIYPWRLRQLVYHMIQRTLSTQFRESPRRYAHKLRRAFAEIGLSQGISVIHSLSYATAVELIHSYP